MSVPYLREALQFGDSEKLIRFVRLHLGDGNEDVGRKEIDKSWMEALKILLRYENPDLDFIEQTMQKDESTLRCSTSICTSISFANPRTDSRWQPLIRVHREPLNQQPIRARPLPNFLQDFGRPSTSVSPLDD